MNSEVVSEDIYSQWLARLYEVVLRRSDEIADEDARAVRWEHAKELRQELENIRTEHLHMLSRIAISDTLEQFRKQHNLTEAEMQKIALSAFTTSRKGE